jgi:simple sugar transport system substrate-binding protein
MQATDARGKFAVGQASDMSHFGPKSHLHSVVNDWSKHYIRSMQSIMDGTWKSRDYWGGMKDGVIVIPKFSDSIPAATRARAQAMIEGIKDGTGHPFAGPIYDQSGKLRVPKGKHMTNAELATMNWYVQGITGSIPK